MPRDEDDDLPPRRTRRPRRDDDEPPQKKSPLPVILVIVASVLVLCGGGCAGLYFALIKPAIEEAKAIVEQQQQTQQFEATRPTEANAAKVKSGMTAAEVTAVVGSGGIYEPTGISPVAIELPGEDGRKKREHWISRIAAKQVEERSHNGVQVLVAYSKPPGDGGTVVGVVVTRNPLDRPESRELIPLPAPPGPPEDRTPRLTATVDTLAQGPQQYIGRYVQVTGKVESAKGTTVVLTGSKAKTRVNLQTGDAYTAGDVITVVGKVGEIDGLTVTLDQGQVVGSESGPPVTFAEFAAEYANDPPLAKKKYEGKRVKLVGQLQAVSGGRAVMSVPSGGGTFSVVLAFSPKELPEKKLDGQVVTVVGKVGLLAVTTDKKSKSLDLSDCTLVK